jgi:hypothetical protein
MSEVETTEVTVAKPVGIKETKELALGVIHLGFYVASLLKDGFQVEDVGKFIGKLTTDEQFKKLLTDAYQDVHLVQDELKDLTLTEGLELAMVVTPAVLKELEALKA